ncbi:MAG TPA: surface-adhesin E family protein [Allosphingosinicella sp.]|jgi:hypothetical protein
MRGKTVVLGLAVVAAASPARAETWRNASSALGATAYIDTDSFQRAGDKVTFWREIRWPEVRTLDGGVRFDRIAAHYEADCRAMTMRSLHLRISLGSEVIASAPDTGAVEQPPEGTAGRTDLLAVCRGEWPRQ